MQIHRLFEIVHILLNKETVTAAELASRFEVSPRTVYRDIDVLGAAGIPVYMSKGRGGGIRLMSGYVLNKTVLSKEEKSELMAAVSGMNAVRCTEAKAALEKLGSLFGNVDSPEQNWIEIDFSNWYNQEETSRIFNALKTAILRRTVVEFTYYSGSGGETQRATEPLRLVYRGQAWYLFAFCHLRNDTRFFKLTRIKNLHNLAETFDRTHAQAVLTQSNYLTDAHFVHLKLKINQSAAFRVHDEFDQSHVTIDADGSFIVEFDFPVESEWLFSYIASFADAVEVLEPPEIRAAFTDKLRQILGKYE